MSTRTHRKLLLLATVAWAVFWVIGLPDYYQQYSTATMIWFDGLLLVPITAAFHRMLSRLRADRRLVVSLWMAFYFTVPLAIYDWLYCGLYLAHGWAFVTRFWYLSVYYVIPWIILPACVVWLRTASPGRQTSACSGRGVAVAQRASEARRQARS